MKVAASFSKVEQKFILHWGDMGTRWGINRTVAQIYALLYISPNPLTAEEIATTLFVARSNVSNSLHELQRWGVVKVGRALGSRADHFEALKDVWETFQIVIAERKRREVDPTRDVLKECLEQIELEGGSAYAKERLTELTGLFETTNVWYDEVRSIPPGTLKRLLKLGKKVQDLLR